MIRSSILAIAFALLGVAWAPLPFAQVGQPTAEQTAEPYSDAELQSFAEAALEVKRIKAGYASKLQAAASAEEQQNLKEAASQEMKRAVEERGISVDKYQEILANALTNPELAQRINKYFGGTRV